MKKIYYDKFSTGKLKSADNKMSGKLISKEEKIKLSHDCNFQIMDIHKMWLSRNYQQCYIKTLFVQSLNIYTDYLDISGL